ncbi:MAG: hypothetical protein ACKVLJ_11725 [Cytophagales bacterium]|jgi:hypothetical protein|tara:strand:- start:144 stop:365 length:222 start_codon:yes stop_codon:yes gene_type:complete
MAKLKKAIKWLFGNFNNTAGSFFLVIIMLTTDIPNEENLDERDYFWVIFACLIFAAAFFFEIVAYRKKMIEKK